MHSGGPSSVLNGTTYFQIPKSGLIEFKDLNFYDVASGYRLAFKVIVNPANPRFANMSLVSDSFDVKQRQFYLAVKQPPKDVNDSVAFGQQPLIEVRDLGTNLAAKPLKRPWNVTVSIKNNPPGNGSISGVLTIAVVNEVAKFTDLRISGYGVGYTLEFLSNFGHKVRLNSNCSFLEFSVSVTKLKFFILHQDVVRNPVVLLFKNQTVLLQVHPGTKQCLLLYSRFFVLLTEALAAESFSNTKYYN